VSRYENFKRQPSVVMIFAFEIIFNQPASELFAGSYEAVRRDIQTRAKRLARSLAAEAQDRRIERKLILLRSIVDCKESPAGRP
jgi:transcriptional regulator with XRE-family HTH domain